MFVLLFAFVFGGAIPVPGGGSYREFLMPGIFVQTWAPPVAVTQTRSFATVTPIGRSATATGGLMTGSSSQGRYA